MPFNAANTLVIAGSASNGGAAVLRAAEQDTAGLIDGVVAAEPVTEMPTATGYGILFGGVAVTGYGKTLADYVTYGNLYQPCAALAAPAAMAEISVFNYLVLTAQTGRATARCTSLAAKGLVTRRRHGGASLDALNKLRAFGWTPSTTRCTTPTTVSATPRSCRRCTRPATAASRSPTTSATPASRRSTSPARRSP